MTIRTNTGCLGWTAYYDDDETARGYGTDCDTAIADLMARYRHNDAPTVTIEAASLGVMRCVVGHQEASPARRGNRRWGAPVRGGRS